MQVRFASGSGSPPRHVSQLRHEGSGGVLVIAGGTAGEEKISFNDEAGLVARCQALIQRKVAFATGGPIPGPAEQLETWQAEGRLTETFLRLSWRGPQQWLLHEIRPGGTPPWTQVEPGALTR